MSPNLPLVSAVIPVYNGERFLSETIESVLAQTYSNIECIVVNDGSTDATGEIARSFGEKIRYFEKPNGGVSSARNLGIEKASGELVAFLDADDLWDPSKIAKQVEAFESDRSVGLIYSDVLIVDESGIVIGASVESKGDPLEEILSLRRPVYLTMTGLVPRVVLDSIGGFDERLSTSADADMACRIALKYKVVSLEEPLASYRQHSNQMHLNLEALEGDMNLVYEKTFATDQVPAAVRKLRPRAYASLESTLSIGNLSKRNFRAALLHLGRALRWDLATTGSNFARLIKSKSK